MATTRFTANRIMILNYRVLGQYPLATDQIALRGLLAGFDGYVMMQPFSSSAQRAAVLAFGIIKYRPFSDGTKRTAELVANEYLAPIVLRDDPLTQTEVNRYRIISAHRRVRDNEMDVEDLAAVYEDILSGH